MTDPERANSIRAALSIVRQRIGEAAARAGRDPAAIKLVAVSKTHGPETVRAAVEAGQLLFGENRIEEAGPKMLRLSDIPGLEWHMVGHVQSRKAREVAGAGFALVHSVDTLRLAERLGPFAAQANRSQDVLLECNVSGEANKFGLAAAEPERWPDLLSIVEHIVRVPGLTVRGLMTMAPQVDQPQKARPYCERLRQLRNFLAERLPGGVGVELSMGMTDDFEAAIEAGATIVRIGRAIFGERQ